MNIDRSSDLTRKRELTTSDVSPGGIRTAPRLIPPYVFLGFVWIVSFVVLMLPAIESLPLRLFFISVPVVLTLIVTWSRPEDGYLVWSFVIAILVLQTGFQLDIGQLRISALEIITLLLLLLLYWQQRYGLIEVNLRLPGQTQLLIFIVFASVMLAVSLASGTPAELAIMPYKGFVLYPLIAYILIAGLQTEQAVRRFSILIVGGYTILSILALFQFNQGITLGTALFDRVDAEYAPVNIFGITAAVAALFIIGLAVFKRLPAIIYIMIGIMIAGAVVSLARSASIVLIAGALFLLVIGRGKRRLFLLVPLLIVLIILLILPEELLFGRLLQFTDSSTIKRQLYLLNGLQAWKQRWLLGWGWGKSFLYAGFSGRDLPSLWEGFLSSGGVLITQENYPWYHNDYLNLLVQVGAVGLALYLAFWQRVFKSAFNWIDNPGNLEMRGYVVGSIAALFGLLIGALFEHVLWRPDIAGLVGVFLGLLVAGMRADDLDHHSGTT